jgi:class 3 adenylate cyclase
MGTERKLATMLFADLVGSTARASGQDPEYTRHLLDRFYESMAAEIRRAGGTVEKFVGDAVMAAFGAPSAREDHAERALHAALSMQRRLGELFGDQLALRIGVNTGEVVVGEPREGSSFVSGDPVNVAARLEQAAGPGEILVGDRTADAVIGAFEFGERRTVEAKGKAQGVGGRPLLRERSTRRVRGISTLARPFVGREVEIRSLTRAYRQTVERGSPTLLTIAGEAGVGKTRVVEEFWRGLEHERPAPVRRVGRCLPFGHVTPYQPLGDILREHLGLLESDGLERVRLVLGDREILALALGFDVAGDLHPLVVRERLHLAFRAFFEELVAQHPAVVVVEDVHWAEQPLMELLESVATEVAGPLLVLGTARPDGSPLPTGETLLLEALAAEEQDRLLAGLLGAQPPAALARLVARAEGNPFFIEELLSTLMDGGLLIPANGSWRLEELPADFALPDSVRALLAARIDLLTPLEKAARQAGALVGPVFWAGPVHALVEGGTPDFGMLEERSFVHGREPSSRAGEPEYEMRHALTREVAYASIPKARKARLHLAFAEWLERLAEGDEHAAVLAHHYGEAVRDDYARLAWPRYGATLGGLERKAVLWLRRASQLAIGRYEVDEGIGLLERALAVTRSDAVRGELWREIGRANALKFDGAAFWAALEQSLAVDSDRASRAETFSMLAFETANRAAMWGHRPAPEIVDAWIKQALELAEPSSLVRARALVAKGYWHPDQGEGPGREAELIARRLRDLELRVFAWGAQAAAAFEEGRFEDAYVLARRRLAVISRVGDPDRVAEILELAIPAVTAVGRIAKGRQLAKRSDELSLRLSPHHRVHAVAQTADVEELAGNWEAIRALTQLVEDRVAANMSTPCVRNARSLLLCAVAWAYLGDDSRAIGLERAAQELGMDGYGYALDPPLLRLALIRGDLAAAKDLLAVRPARTYTMGVGLLAARLDGLAAIGDGQRIEAEALQFLRPGIYLEPFALRALGIVRHDSGLVGSAVARFLAAGLPWYAAQTPVMAGRREPAKGRLASSRP